MKRGDRIKLDFTRNWKLPGKERLANLLKPSAELKTKFKNGIAWLTDEDIAIYTDADSYIEWSIMSNGTYENEIGKLIRISLTDGSTALDIGANIGLQSIRMSRACGNGKVYAFEPLNHLQEKFRKNIRLNHISNVTLLPFALSETARDAEFKINIHAWNQGTFSISNQSRGTETQRVVIRVADEVQEIKALERLDLIKIDVEGFELPVMRGLQQTIAKFRPRIIFEYDAAYWVNSGHSIRECIALLAGFNYKFYQITPVGCEYIHELDEIESGNIFCIRD